MLDVESQDDLNFTKIASVGVNALTREVAKTAYSPLMQQGNPARSNLHTRLRAIIRKTKAHGHVFVTFRGKIIEVSDAAPVSHMGTYEMIFEHGKFIKTQELTSVYNG